MYAIIQTTNGTHGSVIKTCKYADEAVSLAEFYNHRAKQFGWTLTIKVIEMTSKVGDIVSLEMQKEITS